MARKNLNMIKMLKAITFLSLAMCLMLNINVVYADCNRKTVKILNDGIRIFLTDSDITSAFNDDNKKAALKKSILGWITHYSSPTVKKVSFDLTHVIVSDWEKISKDTGKCGAELEFSCKKDKGGKLKDCFYVRAKSQK